MNAVRFVTRFIIKKRINQTKKYSWNGEFFLIKTAAVRVIGLTKENVSKLKFLMSSFCQKIKMILVHKTKQGRTL